MMTHRRYEERDERMWDGSADSATQVLKWMFPDIEEDAMADGESTKRLILLGVNPGEHVIRNENGSFRSQRYDDYAEIMGRLDS